MAEGKRHDEPGSAGKGKRPERKPFLLRLSPGLMKELKAWSSQEFRSLNGHLEFLLQSAVNQRKRKDSTSEDSP